jgi:predicted phosphodiesterase
VSGSSQSWRCTRFAYALTAAGTAAVLTIGLIPSASADRPATVTGIIDGDGMELSRAAHPVARGAELTTYQSLESDKWLDTQVLTVDLSEDIVVDYLSSDDVSEAAAPVSELTAAHDPGPGRTAVAAINADFFDINATNAPLAPGIRDGRLTQSGSLGRTKAVGIDEDGAGRILDILFAGKAATADAELPLSSYNSPALPADGIGIYTHEWGAADRVLPVLGSDDVTEVVVEDGEVVSVSEKPGSGRIADDATVLLGRDAGADALAGLAAGDAVELEYGPYTADGSELPRTAVGGNGMLVIDGEPQDWENRPNNGTAPRTAVGFSADGSDMYVITVDGRQAHSGGVTLTELAVMMADLGAHTALNLDGGGSTTLLAREPGAAEPRLANEPSDGEERPVPNGLVFTAPEGGGRAAGFQVSTAADPALAPSGEAIGDGNPDRVFSGLSRQLTADAYDRTYGPAAPTAPRWQSLSARHGTVDRDGLFTAGRPGIVKVHARSGLASGSTELTVLDKLTRMEPTQQRIGLADSADHAGFGLLGFDAAGYTAPVDPADVRLEYDASLFDIEPDPASGGFTVTARTDDYTSTVITASVGTVSTVLAASVGFQETVVADFESAADWRFSHARAAGSLFAEPTGREGAALGMAYDFSLSTGTRAAYATPVGGDIQVPGQPHSFTLWVNGDARRAWPSLHLVDGAGTSQVLRAPHIEHRGWEQLTFTVPEGITYPVSVRRFYIAETRPDIQYTSEIVIDELVANTPPDIDLPDTGEAADPLITTQRSADGRDWRFAVVSDAQFVARNPDSDLVRAARRTLRDAKASNPDFVIINGDWVDEAALPDLEFARDMIEEELGDLPWYYIPGNHEVMGGSIEQWMSVFGDRQQTFDHRGTRFVTLDTSSLSISGGGYAQWQELRRQLDRAARDRSISSVIVMGHVPPRDTNPQPASQLTDRMDARLLERWLADFRADTGKGVAFLGAHVGIFDSYRMSGVPYLINGNAGKGPSAPPDEGGFSGWSTVGVDRVSLSQQLESRRHPHLGLPDWISVQTRPHVDGLTLNAPDSVAVGERAEATATVQQQLSGGQPAVSVPAVYPVSTDWAGSRSLHIGDPAQAGRTQLAAFDPATGQLTALRPGAVTLKVTVNGETRSAEIRITR